MPTKKQRRYIDEFIKSLCEEDKYIFTETSNYLFELGYKPSRQKRANSIIYLLKRGNKSIAMIEKSQESVNAKYKFRLNGCEEFNQRFMDGLINDITNTKMRYTNVITTKSSENQDDKTDIRTCNYCGELCTNGGRRYYCKLPDGTEVLRCAAYLVAIPNYTKEDLNWTKEMLLEQHNYHISLESD